MGNQVEKDKLFDEAFKLLRWKDGLITALQSQLAKSEKEGDDIALELSDMEIAKDQLFEEALAYKASAEKAEAMVERLIDAGEYLAESYREKWTLDDEHASTWRWDALVAERKERNE